jgi:hypothetical protein
LGFLQHNSIDEFTHVILCQLKKIKQKYKKNSSMLLKEKNIQQHAAENFSLYSMLHETTTLSIMMLKT